MLVSNPLAQTTVTDTTDASGQKSPEQAMFYALVLLWSASEPHRVGQTAILDPFEELYVGRGDRSERKFARFGWHRPGQDLVVQPGQEFLAGERISRLHLLLIASAVGVEMKHLGRRGTRVNGKECGETTTPQEGDTIMVAKQALLRVVRRPRQLPLPEGWRELHPFAEPDAAGIVGESLQAWELRRDLELAARYDRHVLIRGETGTGKEMAAAVVHKRSSRAGQRFVAVNVANVAESLLESELFGIVADYPDKGTPAKAGYIAAADRGTLFLDEIGECSPKMQKALLRLLQSGEYNRVGEATVARHVDERVVGATHRGDEVFRDDFLGRFIQTVRLRPLRERAEDIVLLVRHLLVALKPDEERRARLFFQGASGRLEPRLSGNFVEYLVRHRLPRNTRELEHILLNALKTSLGDVITLPGLDDEPEPAAAPASGAASERGSEKGRGAKAITKDQLLAALRHYGDNVSRAAKALGVGRTAMYELMDRHGIKKGDPTA
jgi:DNA-binding NtrC family response regulator